MQPCSTPPLDTDAPVHNTSIGQEAGATPALELAFTLADGLEYIR